MSERLESGETGVRRDPAELPRPVLWAAPRPGQQPQPVSGRLDDNGDQDAKRARTHLPLAYTGVALMLLGLALLGLAMVLVQWWPLAVGAVVGSTGIALAVRSRILEDVSEGSSPAGA